VSTGLLHLLSARTKRAGGPLLNLKVAKYITLKLNEWCTHNNITFSVSIVTNGVLLDMRVYEFLKSFNLSSIQVTIDGPAEVHNKRRMFKNGSGTFDVIIDNIAKISRDYKIGVRINVDKNNLKFIPETLDVLKTVLYNFSVSFGHVHSSNDTFKGYANLCIPTDQFSKIHLKLVKLALSKGVEIDLNSLLKPNIDGCADYHESAFVIDPRGDLYKCWEVVGNSKAKVGSKFDDSFNYNYFKWVNHSPLKVEKCRKCEILPLCGGGCVGLGSFSNPYCYPDREKVKELVKLLVKNKYEAIIDQKE